MVNSSWVFQDLAVRYYKESTLQHKTSMLFYNASIASDRGLKDRHHRYYHGQVMVWVALIYHHLLGSDPETIDHAFEKNMVSGKVGSNTIRNVASDVMYIANMASHHQTTLPETFIIDQCNYIVQVLSVIAQRDFEISLGELMRTHFEQWSITMAADPGVIYIEFYTVLDTDMAGRFLLEYMDYATGAAQYATELRGIINIEALDGAPLSPIDWEYVRRSLDITPPYSDAPCKDFYVYPNLDVFRVDIAPLLNAGFKFTFVNDLNEARMKAIIDHPVLIKASWSDI